MDAAAFGRYLSEARIARELSLVEAARQTHIKQEILAALEQGEFERAQVSRLQLRGMLRNYARFLRQDPNQILTWFDAIWEGRGTSQLAPPAYHSRSADLRKSSAKAGASRQWRWLVIFVLLLLLSGVLVLLALAMARLGDRDEVSSARASGGAEGLSPAIEQSLRPSPTSLLLVPPAGSVAENQELSSENGIAVVVEITQRGWLKAFVDGEVRYEGLALVGDQLTFEAEAELRLESANAAGLSVTYLGETLSGLGTRGQLIALTIRHSGVASELGPGLSTAVPATITPVVTVTAIELGAVSEPSATSTPAAPTVTSFGGVPATITEAPLSPILSTPTAIPTSIPASLTPTAILPLRTPMGLPPTKAS